MYILGNSSKNDMRRTFEEILQSNEIDIKEEYSRLYRLFYGTDPVYANRDMSFYRCMADHFMSFRFRDTCLSLTDFNSVHGFDFQENPKNIDTDYLVSFMEYLYNFAMDSACNKFGYFFKSGHTLDQYRQQIESLADKIGYDKTSHDGIFVFFPFDAVANEVVMNQDISDADSYRIITYHHHLNKGNLDEKKHTLKVLADLLEPKEKDLKTVNDSLRKNLFFCFNNLNIRHNNLDKNDAGNYKQWLDEMSDGELERYYDITYHMALHAFMSLEYLEEKKEIEELMRK